MPNPLSRSGKAHSHNGTGTVTRPQNSKGVFIHDVAKAAGCSISTVSKALNNTGSISAKMRKQILKIAQDLGYSAHPGAKFLRGRRSENIGLFYFQVDLFNNPFYGAVGSGVEEILGMQNYNLLIAAAQMRDGTYEVPKFVRERSVDGILVMGNVETSIMVRLIESNLPLVLVDTELPGYRVDSIVSDGFNGAREAVRHLMAHGHRKIGMLAASREDSSTRRRFEGYTSTLAEAGISVRPDLIERGVHNEQGGVEATRRLLSRTRDFTALFVINDEMAIGAITALRESGLRVPQDVSIVGFDDIQLSHIITPSLTTMRVDQIKMGRVAATVLLEKVNSEPETPMQRVFPVELVERQTVLTLS